MFAIFIAAPTFNRHKSRGGTGQDRQVEEKKGNVLEAGRTQASAHTNASYFVSKERPAPLETTLAERKGGKRVALYSRTPERV